MIDEILMYAFVVFWIAWVAVSKKEPGRWLIRFCEGPLTTFATFIDQNVIKMADFFVWSSKNPVAALQIKKEEVKLKVIKPVGITEDIKESRKRYPGELPRLTLGASLFLILLLFLIYLILYLLW
ncbi:MAG: hypothetical protein AEth_00694 [Candidatus Argoarchaeum ethanivorans]|uniref:Uncharacterized protein n=1 Tax=Candidatus Argoarchaeum ethanivorans TaxID=2608793 RepID=A0A8B3S3R3_9EURY|nr:MAG: hypothetical protein AEth_00694 [Candidatus Argoarchaeum ethanivorans]